MNDCAREMMASIKKWFTRAHGLTDAGVLVPGVLGSTVTVSVSYDVAPASLFTGFEFSFKAGAACPAGALIAINGLGNKNLQKVIPSGYTNVEANDYLANQHVKGKYDATLDKCILLTPLPTSGIIAASDTAAGPIELAIQSEMETGTDVLRAVTPGRQHFHPSAAKFWAQTNVSATVAVSYNVSGASDVGTGAINVAIGNDISSANYAPFVLADSGAPRLPQCENKAASTMPIRIYNLAGALADPTDFMCGGFGDL